MDIGLVGSLVLVTVGALLAGHTVVRWARRAGAAGEHGPALAVACGTVAVGLALRGGDTLSTVILCGALALMVAGLLAFARRRARTPSE